MNLYLRHGLSGGAQGTVFHLREKCAEAPDSVVQKLTDEEARHYRKNLGVRRIYIRCRKAVGRRRP